MLQYISSISDSKSSSSTYVNHPLNAFEKLAQSRDFSDKIAIFLGEQKISYCNLNRRANRLANYLLSLRLPHESIIGLHFYSSIEFVISLFAVWKAGLAYIPLSANDQTVPEERLLDYINGIEVPLIITDAQLKDRTLLKNRTYRHPPLFINSETLNEEFKAHSEEKPDITFSPSQLAYVVCSSGTTGKPKQILIEFKGLVPCIQSLTKSFDVTERDKMATFADIGFDASISEILIPLSTGATLLIVPHEIRHQPIRLGHYYSNNDITVAIFTPSMARDLDPARFPKLRVLTLVGEAFEDELAKKWRVQGVPTESSPRLVTNGYGPSEVTIATSVAIYDPSEPLHIGQPIQGLEMFVLEEINKETKEDKGEVKEAETSRTPILKRVAPEAEGELYIAGIGLARCYMDMKTTKERFFEIPHPDEPGKSIRVYRTGDTAKEKIVKEKRLIVICGRTDRQIKPYGHLVCPEEIESCLQKHPSVRYAYVNAKLTTKGDPDLTAYIEFKDEFKSGENVKPTDLRLFLKRYLPSIMIPKRWCIVDRMPMASAEKINGTTLKEMKDVKFSYIQERGIKLKQDEEKRLAEIWNNILFINDDNFEFHADDDFFNLGGTSMQAKRLLEVLHTTLQVKIDPNNLKYISTIGSQARYIRRIKKSLPEYPELISLVPESVTKSAQLPLILVHSLLGDPEADYHKLKNVWTFERAVYGIKARGRVHPEDMDDNLIVVVMDYIHLLKNRWPRGPYLLGGWSAGGIIAFVMANLLKERGEDVAVMMIDSESPVIYNKKTEREFTDYLFDLFAKKIGPLLGVITLGVNKTQFVHLTKPKQLHLLFDSLERKIEHETKNSIEKQGLVSTIKNILLAVLHYEIPRTAISDILLIAAKETQRVTNDRLNWPDFINFETAEGKKDIVPLEGNHESIMLDSDFPRSTATSSNMSSLPTTGPRRIAYELNQFCINKIAEFRSRHPELEEDKRLKVPSVTEASTENVTVGQGGIIRTIASGGNTASAVARTTGSRVEGGVIVTLGVNQPMPTTSVPATVESALTIPSIRSPVIDSMPTIPAIMTTPLDAVARFEPLSPSSVLIRTTSASSSVTSSRNLPMLPSSEFTSQEVVFTNGLKRIATYLKELSFGKPKPKCFIVYAWGDEDYAQRLADYLEDAELDIIFDNQNRYKGKKLAYFVNQLKSIDYILAIGTKKYLGKYNQWSLKENKKTEAVIPTGEQLNAQLIYHIEKSDKSFVPLIFEGSEAECFPNSERFEQNFDFSEGESGSLHYVEILLELIRYLYGVVNYNKKWDALVKQTKEEFSNVNTTTKPPSPEVKVPTRIQDNSHFQATERSLTVKGAMESIVISNCTATSGGIFYTRATNFHNKEVQLHISIDEYSRNSVGRRDKVIKKFHERTVDTDIEECIISNSERIETKIQQRMHFKDRLRISIPEYLPRFEKHPQIFPKTSVVTHYEDKLSMPIAEYLPRFEKHPQIFPRTPTPALSIQDSHAVTTWRAITRIKEQLPIAETIFRLCAYFDTHNIPISLFNSICETPRAPIHLLHEHSLIEFLDEEVFSIQHSIQEVIQINNKDKSTVLITQALQLMAQTFKYDENDDSFYRETLRLVPHAERVLAHAEKHGIIPVLPPKSRVTILTELTSIKEDKEEISKFACVNAGVIMLAMGAYYCVEQRNFIKAISYLKCALRMVVEPVQQAAIYTYLGASYTQVGDYLQVQTYCDKALTIYKKECCDNHIGEVRASCSLGYIAHANNEYERAYNLYQKCLKILNTIELTGQKFPFSRELILHGLGDVYAHPLFKDYNIKRAEEFYLQSLNKKRLPQLDKYASFSHLILGEATKMCKLAHFYHAQRNHILAQSYYEQAQKLIHKICGNEPHHEKAILFIISGAIFHSQEQHTDAIRAYEQAGEEYKKIYGETNNINLMNVKLRIGNVFLMQSEYEQAKKNFKNILEAGKDFEIIKQAKLHLCQLAILEADEKQIEPLYAEILKEAQIFYKTDKHVIIADIHLTIGRAWRKKQQHHQALLCYQAALAIQREILGETHEVTLLIWSELATLCYEQQKYEAVLNYSLHVRSILTQQDNTIISIQEKYLQNCALLFLLKNKQIIKPQALTLLYPESSEYTQAVSTWHKQDHQQGDVLIINRSGTWEAQIILRDSKDTLSDSFSLTSLQPAGLKGNTEEGKEEKRPREMVLSEIMDIEAINIPMDSSMGTELKSVSPSNVSAKQPFIQALLKEHLLPLFREYYSKQFLTLVKNYPKAFSYLIKLNTHTKNVMEFIFTNELLNGAISSSQFARCLTLLKTCFNQIRSPEIPKLLFTVANTLMNAKTSEPALACYLDALALLNQLDNQQIELKININIRLGNYYKKIKNYPEAIKHYEQIFNLYTETDVPLVDRIKTAVQLAHCYLQQRQFFYAEQCFRSALNCHDQLPKQTGFENAKANLKELAHELNMSGIEFDTNNTCILGIDNAFSLHLTYEPNSQRLYLYSPLLDGLPPVRDGARLRLYEDLLQGSQLGGKMAGCGVGVAVKEELILIHATLEMQESDPLQLCSFSGLFIKTVETWCTRCRQYKKEDNLKSSPSSELSLGTKSTSKLIVHKTASSPIDSDTQTESYTRVAIERDLVRCYREQANDREVAAIQAVAFENVQANLREVACDLKLADLKLNENNTCILRIDDKFSWHITYEPNSQYLYVYFPLLDSLPKEDDARLKLYEELLEGSLLGGKMAGGGVGVAMKEELVLMHFKLNMRQADPQALSKMVPLYIDTVEKWRSQCEANRSLLTQPKKTQTMEEKSPSTLASSDLRTTTLPVFSPALASAKTAGASIAAISSITPIKSTDTSSSMRKTL